MTESRSMEEWQLQNTSEGAEQWQLLDTEQQLPFEMQLQSGPSSAPGAVQNAAPSSGWQPVEHSSHDPQSGGGGNWLLPTLIIFALVSAVGYIGWLGWTGLEFGTAETAISPAVSEPEVSVAETTASTDTEGAAESVAEEAAAQEPIAEAVAAAPTVAPVQEAESVAAPLPTEELVEQTFATIASQYGLNARSSPSTEGDVVVLLDDGATYAVVDQGVDGWVQLQLDDGEEVWVSSDFVDINSQLIPAEAAIGQATEGAVALSTEPSTIVPPAPFTNAITGEPSVVIDAEVGVNARADTSTDAVILQTLPQGAALGVVGKSEDGEWLQVALPNKDAAWVSAEAVRTVGSLDAVSTPSAVAEVEREAGAGAEVELDATRAVTSTDEVLGDSEAPPVEDIPVETEEAAQPADELLEPVEQATATVSSSIGITTRLAPNADAELGDFVSGKAELLVTGRSADSEWLLVTLESGDEAWVFAANMELDVEVAQLPVVEP